MTERDLSIPARHPWNQDKSRLPQLSKWPGRALCDGVPGFDTDRPDRAEWLREWFCDHCPVMAQCAALRQPDDTGVWGGELFTEAPALTALDFLLTA